MRVLRKLVTGGQTGVDRATLDVCLELGFEVGGWCPKGRLAEDGPIASKYPLIECESEDYSVRTDLNVRDSDGTLIIGFGELEGGTKLTEERTTFHTKPVLVIDACKIDNMTLPRVLSWIIKHNIGVLNVAGPRESLIPGVVYAQSKEFLRALLSQYSAEE